ncbi:hypothetical protein, partial [Rhodovarius sp.]|uniref:hypothetical protein n=1 Tax=Rhodovarius sp. TaxID=2972673 RepID=UPI0034A1703A
SGRWESHRQTGDTSPGVRSSTSYATMQPLICRVNHSTPSRGKDFWVRLLASVQKMSPIYGEGGFRGGGGFANANAAS